MMMPATISLVLVGGLLGVTGTLIGTLCNYLLRRQERKAARRRELYERELVIVNDAVDAIMDTVAKIWKWPKKFIEMWWDEPSKLIVESDLRIRKAEWVTHSLENQELEEKYAELVDSFRNWIMLVDFESAGAAKGKEKEFDDLTLQLQEKAAQVWRCIRGTLQEVC